MNIETTKIGIGYTFNLLVIAWIFEFEDSK